MSSKNKLKNKNKKADNNKQDVTQNENLAEELEKYLKITEEEMKTQYKKEEVVKNIKKKYELIMEEIRKMKKEGNKEGMLANVLELAMINSELELKSEKINTENQNYTRDLRLFEEQNPLMSNKIQEYEKYNKMLLEKVKEFNETKAQIINQENEKTKTILGKCEEFKQDCINKFQVDEVEQVKKENESLREKLDEYKKNAKLIEDGMKEQIDMKDKQSSEMESGLENQISPTLKELETQNEKFKNENVELVQEINSLRATGNDLTRSLDKFNSTFESTKKDFEKKTQELIKLMKENKELKMMDPNSLNKDNESFKKELDSIVSQNKELADKIAKLKSEIQK